MDSTGPAIPPDGGSSGAVATARDAFRAKLRELRVSRGKSQSGLAKNVQYHTSYISKIETGREDPPEELARRADSALNAHGALIRLWCEYADLRRGTARPARRPVDGAALESLRIIDERATLTYTENHLCEISVVRTIKNTGTFPVNSFDFHIRVDGYPDDPDRSKAFHQANPLVWRTLAFRSWYRPLDDPEQEGPVEIECGPAPDRAYTDQIIDGVAIFRRKGHGQTLPLYPGLSATLGYSYVVTAAQWGFWYQRHVRLPTERMAAVLDFPARFKPTLWHREITPANPEPVPFKLPPRTIQSGNRKIWSWALDNPTVNDRYRFIWDFPAHVREEAFCDAGRSSR